MTIVLNSSISLALSLFLYVIGQKLVHNIRFLKRALIPGPVIGGLLFSILHWVLRSLQLAQFRIDTTWQIPAMSVFFASVGLSIAFQRKTKLGPRAMKYWLLCAMVIFGQNLLGVGLAVLLGIAPFLGVLAGSASMVGGHGLAVSVGPTAEALGIAGAQAVAVATATFGLIAGAFLGGPTARNLIEHLPIPNPPKNTLSAPLPSNASKAGSSENPSSMTKKTLVSHALLFAGLYTLSSLSVPLLESWFPGLQIPASVLSMILGLAAGAVLRQNPFFSLHQGTTEWYQNASLAIFLSMASMSLALWELAALALPIFLILLAQCVFTVTFSMKVTFPFMGGDYNAAVMASGMIGHALGATPTALANMETIVEQHGPAQDAFLLVPLGGGFLGDLINVPVVLFLLNFLL